MTGEEEKDRRRQGEAPNMADGGGIVVCRVERRIRPWSQRKVVGWPNERSEECVCFGGDIVTFKFT